MFSATNPPNEEILGFIASSSWKRILEAQELKGLNPETVSLSYEMLKSFFTKTVDGDESDTLESLRKEFAEAEESYWTDSFIEQATYEKQSDLDSLIRSLTDLSIVEPNGWEMPDLLEDRKKLQQVLRFASWTAPKFYEELIDSELGRNQITSLVDSWNTIPRIAFLSKIAYPFGGGQASFQEIAIFANILGLRVIWVSLGTPKGSHNFEILSENKHYESLYKTHLDRAAYLNFIRDYNPAAIITEGELNPLINELNQGTNIPVHRIFHFWNGLIKNGTLGSGPIEKLLEGIELEEEFELSESHDYFVSQFMKNVYREIGGRRDIPILTPSMLRPFTNKKHLTGEVLQVNLHPNKGGQIFHAVVGQNPNENFLGVDSDSFSGGKTDSSNSQPNLRVVPWLSRRHMFESKKALLFPSQLHETFGRVAIEAIQSGIPVFAFQNGNLPLLLGSNNTFSEKEYLKEVQVILKDDSQLSALLERQTTSVQQYFETSESTFYLQFIKMLVSSLSIRNVGIFTAWSEQGLGNQSHYYTKILRSIGFKVHIFAYKPYDNVIANPDDSKLNDWDPPAHCDSVTRSRNIRENVEIEELKGFILDKRIGILLVPEVCWPRNWNRLLKLREVNNLNIKIIPNSETLLKNEIENHRYFDSILTPTKQARDIFYSYGFSNVEHIGHGIGEVQKNGSDNGINEGVDRSGIKFLHVAGHNPLTRKNTDKVIQAFAASRKVRTDNSLLVTSTKPIGHFWTEEIPEGVEIISKVLTRNEIQDLYQKSDISIQVASHEGIGLGFYESIAAGVPVIALDAQPNNEVVLDGSTGWLIPCIQIPLPDNPQGIVCASKFDLRSLVDVLTKIEKSDLETLNAKLVKVHADNFSRLSFQINLSRSMKYGHQHTHKVSRSSRTFDFLKLIVYLMIVPLWKTFKKVDSFVQGSNSKGFVSDFAKKGMERIRQIIVIRYGHLGIIKQKIDISSSPQAVKVIFKIFKGWLKN